MVRSSFEEARPRQEFLVLKESQLGCGPIPLPPKSSQALTPLVHTYLLIFFEKTVQRSLKPIPPPEVPPTPTVRPVPQRLIASRQKVIAITVSVVAPIG